MNISQFYKKNVLELKSSGSPTPELDANILIENVLGKDRTFLFSHPLEPLTNAQYSKLKRLINRRKKGEPIAYITGHKEFYGLDFVVNKNVLIPRPETENLIEEALKITEYRLLNMGKKQLPNNQYSRFDILDVGTGSGCLIVLLFLELKKRYKDTAMQRFSFYASDISKSALRVAKLNAKRLLNDNPTIQQSNNPRFIHSDLFSNRLLHKKFDLIVANLPYVPYSRKLDPESTIKFEPKIAIFAGDNGSEVIKRFILDSKDRLKPGGSILLELDPRNTDDIAVFAKSVFPSANISAWKDLAKWERYLKVTIK
jgi:release factor glutamine methyltransferase